VEQWNGVEGSGGQIFFWFIPSPDKSQGLHPLYCLHTLHIKERENKR